MVFVDLTYNLIIGCAVCAAMAVLLWSPSNPKYTIQCPDSVQSLCDCVYLHRTHLSVMTSVCGHREPPSLVHVITSFDRR